MTLVCDEKQTSRVRRTTASEPRPTGRCIRLSQSIPNRGTGAGGANTNANGKSFEQKTSNESRLLDVGFIRKRIPGTNAKHGFYLEGTLAGKDVIYLTQGGLKAYFAHFFQTSMCRSPDEAYLTKEHDHYTLTILEKKNQNTAGSVDTKLLAGKGFIDEYEFLLEQSGKPFRVRYGFCISAYLKNDYTADSVKSKALAHINHKHGIQVLFGDDDDYYAKLDAWLVQ
jgi:hypothetical protein